MECEIFDVGCHALWWWDNVTDIALTVFLLPVKLFILLLGLIPAPDFLLNGSTFVMPSGVMFFAQFFELNSGIAIYTGAYITRFLIRRIPVIG